MNSEQFKDLVFLTATDTTIGFVSQNAQKLNSIKQRPHNKLFITTLPSLEKLNELTRVPPTHAIQESEDPKKPHLSCQAAIHIA